MARTLAILTIALTGMTSMYAGSLGINPGDYLNPDGSVSIGLMPAVDGITATGITATNLQGNAILSTGTAALPQTSFACASNCQGGLTATPPPAGTATIFQPAGAPEFDLLGDTANTTSAQAWISASTATSPSTITIPVGIFGVSDVSTMLNTVGGQLTGGTVCTTGNGLNAGTGCTNTASYAYITLNFSTTSNGATLQSETFALINGLTQANILDGATAGTSGSTSDYTVTYLGKSYTVDAGLVWGPAKITGGTNANDSLILDAQEFPVFEQFQSLYLTSVSITDTGSANPGSTNHEVLSAVSITPTPEPSTLLLLGAGLAVIGVTRFRNKSVKA